MVDVDRIFAERIRPRLMALLTEEVIQSDLPSLDKAALALRVAMHTFAIAAAAISSRDGAMGQLDRSQAPFFREAMESIIAALEDGTADSLLSPDTRN